MLLDSREGVFEKPLMQNIPLIDISDLQDIKTLHELDDACRQWGFFQVTEHGIPSAVFKNLNDAMHDFFEQPHAAKKCLERSAENPWGFYDQELTKNVKDWKEVIDIGPENGPERPQWPQTLPNFKGAVETFYKEAEQVSRRLLTAIAKNLETAPHVLLSAFEDHTSFLRLNFYPPCPDPAPEDASTVPSKGQLGIGHHSDAGVLTVLFQDSQPGLQVEHGGRWHTVEPVENALVINLGDVVQVWSNDRYRAALHRVLANSENARFSAPFFFNPSYATDYAPLDAMCTTAPPRYRPINWREFRGLRADGDYADYGEEIQISHYRTKS